MGLKVKVDGVWVPATAPTGAPANMVTTDTPQNITGTKTFGVLNADSIDVVNDLSVGNEVYVRGEAVWSNADTSFPDSRYLQLENTGDAQTVLGQVSFDGGTNFALGSVSGIDKSDIGLDNVANLAQVDLVNPQTIGGVKTFSSSPVVPDSSFGVAKLSATGTKSATTVLHGDNTWKTISAAVTAHASTHATGGTDPLTPANIGAASATHTHGVTDLTATGTRSASTFLRGDNTWATVTVAAPSNMVSTDGAQDITGVKQFPPGALLMRNAAGTQTAEPYSDVNPPGSFEMTQAAAPAASPPTGEAVLWTPDGASLYMKNPAGTTTQIGPSAGGGGGGSGTELAATTDYIDTMPTTPATGIKMFARHRARRLPSFVGPSGVDSALQPAMFSNRIMRASAQWANATMIYDAGMPAFTAYGTAAALVTPSMTTTDLFSSMIRVRYASATTANAMGGVRIPTAMWHMSDTANKGGFFIVFRAGFNQMTAGGRAFIGMSATNANLVMTADPTALVNQFGFFMNAADTTWRFMHNDATGVATIPASQPGANFPGKTNATDFYEFRIFCPSGNGTLGSGRRVGWSVTNLRTGAAFNGAEVTTDLPAINTALAFHAVQINVTAAATSLDVQSFYSETDN